MSGLAGGMTLAAQAAACPQCGRAMEAFELEGHYAKPVATDLCPHCNVVWFDEFESVRLSGLGWTQLLRRMNAAMTDGAPALSSQLKCPRCAGQLKPVNDLTRFGRFASLECVRKHGHLQTFALLLAQRGLVRPLSPSDLRALAEEKRTPCCLNCGAAIEGGDRCSHCASPLVVIDMPRLMTALLMRHGDPLPQGSIERIAWPCRGCGAPMEPTQTVRCDHCHHPVVVPSLLDLRPLLDAVEPLLRAALPRQARPHGEKLKNMRADHRATSLHHAMRHAIDVLSDNRAAGSGVPGWIVAGVLSAAVWYFWS